MITKCILLRLLVNNFGYGVADEVINLTDCDNYVQKLVINMQHYL